VNIAGGTNTIARTVAGLISCKTGFCGSICGAIIDCGVGGYIG
jgi:hypothetical protein